MLPVYKNTNIKKEHKIKIFLKKKPKIIKKKQTRQISKETKKEIKKVLALPKGEQFKKITKHKKKIIKKKIIKKKIIKKKIIKKRYIKHVKQKQVHHKKIIKSKPIVKKKDPMAWLYEDKSTQEEEKEKIKKTTNNNNISQNIKELYGSTFATLSTAQQNYILDNQEIMRRITQQVLNRVASVNLKDNIRINTYNIVEFYLHPNGDMTDFRFLTKSGYYELDDTTKETIEYAYSQYPRPKEKTLIRYNVFYNLR